MPAIAPPIDDSLAQGRRLLREGRWEAAVEVLWPQLERAPAHYWLNVELGRAHAGLGDRAAARERFLAAIAGEDPERVCAIYELVRLDVSEGDFARIGLLDEALAGPGELDCVYPAESQKRDHYSQIRFLQALAALHRGDFAEAEQSLRDSSEFSHVVNERRLAFDWVKARLGALGPVAAYPHLEYLRRMVLRIGMDDAIRYQDLLAAIDGPAQVLEIGAMDGVSFDPLHRHIVEKRWDALVVEPLPDMFAALRRTYDACPWVRCANVAVGEESGPLRMYRISREVVEDGAPAWLRGISSAFRLHDLVYFEAAVAEETVRGLSFGDFVEEFGVRAIDILQIDTEGFDWRILRQIDLDRWDIGLIHVELLHVPAPDRLQAFDALARAGYAYTYDGANLTAVRGRGPRARAAGAD